MSDTPKTTDPVFPSISDGPNARPRDVSIGQTAGGLPDDTGEAIDVDPKDEERMRDSLLSEDGEAETEAHPS